MTEIMKVNHTLAMALNEMKKQENDDWHINHHDDACGYDKNWKCLELLTVAELSRALYVGYEIEPGYKVGDWVVYEALNIIEKVIEVEEYGIIRTKSFSAGKIGFRHAMPSEISMKRWWNKHNRVVWELKEGDVITINDQLLEVKSIDDVVITFNNDEWLEPVEFEKIKHNIEIVCFSEFRLDGEDE